MPSSVIVAFKIPQHAAARENNKNTHEAVQHQRGTCCSNGRNGRNPIARCKTMLGIDIYVD